MAFPLCCFIHEAAVWPNIKVPGMKGQPPCYFLLFVLMVFNRCCHRLIIDFLRRKSGPAAEYVTSVVDLVPNLAQLEGNQFTDLGILSVVLGIFLPRTDNTRSPVVDVFHHVAGQFEPGLFYLSDSLEVADHFQVTVSNIDCLSN